VTRKTANAVKAAEADVQRWAKAKGENAKDIAAAEAKMNAADLAIERARLSLAECDKRWTAAKDALAEATYNDAQAELERLDALDAGLVAEYDAAARELKRLARAMWAQGAAKREQNQRAADWANRTGAVNRMHPTPEPYAIAYDVLADPVVGEDLLERLIERRREQRAAHGWV